MSMVDCRCEPRPRGANRWLPSLALVLACGGDGTNAVPRPPPANPTFDDAAEASTSGSAATGSESTTGGELPCGAAEDCEAGDEFCSAPVVGATPGPGEFVCGACLELDQPQRWCLDAASCCDPQASCELGFCRIASATDASSTGGRESSGSETTAGEGSSSEGSSSSTETSGASSDSGSDSGSGSSSSGSTGA
jgi:hypothetical protein